MKTLTILYHRLAAGWHDAFLGAYYAHMYEMPLHKRREHIVRGWYHKEQLKKYSTPKGS